MKMKITIIINNNIFNYNPNTHIYKLLMAFHNIIFTYNIIFILQKHLLIWNYSICDLNISKFKPNIQTWC